MTVAACPGNSTRLCDFLDVGFLATRLSGGLCDEAGKELFAGVASASDGPSARIELSVQEIIRFMFSSRRSDLWVSNLDGDVAGGERLGIYDDRVGPGRRQSFLIEIEGGAAVCP